MGHQRAVNLELILDEDGRAGGDVADRDVLRSCAGFFGPQSDGHRGNLLIAQAAGRDQGVEAIVGREVGDNHHPGDPFVVLGLALVGFQHGGAKIGLAAFGVGLLIELGLTQIGVELIDLDFQVGAERFGGLEGLIEDLAGHGPPGLAAHLVAQRHAGARVQQEDERRGLPFLFLEDDGRSKCGQQAEQ